MDPPSDTIWVGNLPMASDENFVKAVFAAYGQILRVRLLPVSNGKGAAILQLIDVNEAMWLVENLNGNIAQGLTEPIVVKFAKNPTNPAIVAGSVRNTSFVERGNAAANGTALGSNSIEAVIATLTKNGAYPQLDRSNLVKLYVSGLPADTRDIDILRMFAPFGCPIGTNGATAMLREDGSCTGVGFVDCYDYSKAQVAMAAMSGAALPDGKVLRVQPKRNQTLGGTVIS